MRKLETAVLITKGWCLCSGAVAAAIGAGIVQVDVRELWGVSVKIWALFFGAYAVGCNVLYGFLSQTFGNWKASRDLTTPPKGETTAS